MVDCSRLFDNDLPDGSVSSDILSILLAISSVFNLKKKTTLFLYLEFVHLIELSSNF